MEFHIKADDEDAAGSNQVGIAVSRPSRARQLTKREESVKQNWYWRKKPRQ